MSILEVKYAIANADLTAYVYMDLGVPKESPIPKKSGMSDTMQGAHRIINSLYACPARRILQQEEFLKKIEVDYPGPQHAAMRKSMEGQTRKFIKQLEAMENAKYHVVELSVLVVS